MSRAARTLVCAVVMFGGLFMLFTASMRDGWSQDAIVGSVAALTVVCAALEFWRCRA